GEADAARWVVVLAAVAPVGEVTGDGLGSRLRGGGGVVGVLLDIGEDGPGCPGQRRMAGLRFAFDRPADFLPRFVQAAELAQGLCEVVSRKAFARRIAAFDILVCGLPVEGDGFLGAT